MGRNMASSSVPSSKTFLMLFLVSCHTQLTCHLSNISLHFGLIQLSFSLLSPKQRILSLGFFHFLLTDLSPTPQSAALSVLVHFQRRVCMCEHKNDSAECKRLVTKLTELIEERCM